jgi:hypothetical protein
VQSYDPAQATPDENTLAGAVPFTLGSMQHNRNVFDPSISVSQLAQTLPLANGKSIITGVSVPSATLNFERTWSEYHLSAIYTGGETFNFVYSKADAKLNTLAPHYQFHNLAFAQQADWARWHLLLRDDFVVSPGAEFTGQGTGGPGLAAEFSSMLSSSLSGLAQSSLPSQTINTGEAMRYMNSVLGQAEYSLSRRAAITVSGSYGLLHFTVPGYVNSSMIDAQAGYDYLLDPANSVAILGSYGRIDYTGTGNTTTDYVGALAYGRKITGRLAFQVAAGPQEIHSAGPAAGGGFTLVFASVNSALKYELRRSGISLTFARGLTSGSGILLGAKSNTFTGSGHMQLTRSWVGTVNAGYAMNNSLAAAGAATIQFDNWFVGANLGRRIGPHVQISANYGVQRQNAPATCPVGSSANCGTTGLQQTVGLSVNWHLRPAAFGN